MTAAAVDLDDDAVVLEQEVDTSDVSVALAVNGLGPRAWKPGLANKLEESPVEH